VPIETSRGLLAAALRASGRRVYPFNQMAARCRKRHVLDHKIITSFTGLNGMSMG
jgi:hypothetical protein